VKIVASVIVCRQDPKIQQTFQSTNKQKLLTTKQPLKAAVSQQTKKLFTTKQPLKVDPCTKVSSFIGNTYRTGKAEQKKEI
jgi:hypothetical protein